tara:strand:- start:80386 stop:81093 length:708 start_codon:yes stop_codon:yes gene_type:complete
MTVKRFKLYHYPATRSARVRWLLHELLDDDFDIEVVQLYAGEQYSERYLQLNPNHNVPALEIALENGESVSMLESGAMVSLLADMFPERGLAPPPGEFSAARADYLQMLHFGASWMDMMLWQIRLHTHLLGNDSDPRTIARYEHKMRTEVEPQLLGRLAASAYICGDSFSAADCVMGQNVLWARAYGLCRDDRFKEYVTRLSARAAFGKAYSDLGDFSLTPPDSGPETPTPRFTG